MKIRKATGGEMLALWGCPDPAEAPPTARFFCEKLSSGDAEFWTVDDGGALIGELYVFFDLSDRDFADGEDTAYLCAFRVKEGFRGRGIGSRLMKTVLESLKTRGFRGATIGVEEAEEQNVRLYRRLGFDREIKVCTADPCEVDADMRPCACPPYRLLYKEL